MIDDYDTDEERMYEKIRLDTIEECARVAETCHVMASGEGIAAAIRALKDKP